MSIFRRPWLPRRRPSIAALTGPTPQQQGTSGALASSAGAQQAALSGSPVASGSFASTAGGQTAELSGSPVASGSFASTAGGQTASMNGTPVIVGAFGSTAGAQQAELYDGATPAPGTGARQQHSVRRAGMRGRRFFAPAEEISP